MNDEHGQEAHELSESFDLFLQRTHPEIALRRVLNPVASREDRVDLISGDCYLGYRVRLPAMEVISSSPPNK